MHKQPVEPSRARKLPVVRGRCRLCGTNVAIGQTACSLCEHVFAAPGRSALPEIQTQPDPEQFEIVMESDRNEHRAVAGSELHSLSPLGVLIGFVMGAAIGAIALFL